MTSGAYPTGDQSQAKGPSSLSRLWQACPVCKGMGVVNRPPGVAADQQTFTSASAGPWPCRTCNGETIIVTPDANDV